MKLFKQRNIGTLFGKAKIIIGQASPYVNWISLALVGVMSFYTTLGPLFDSWGMQLPFWMFLAVLIILIVIMLVIEWVFLLPSYFGAANVQSWEHENPQRDLLEKIERDIIDNKRELSEIKKILEKHDR